EAFESAQARDGTADVAAFLPPPADPLYLPALRELVRVDLEYGWRRGRPARLGGYRRPLPEPVRGPAGVAEITFEEYRLRRQLGEDPTPAEYQQRFGVNTAGWPDPRPPAPGTRAPGAPAAHSEAPDRTQVVPPDVLLAEAALAYYEVRL